jgi:hypothetical protein
MSQLVLKAHAQPYYLPLSQHGTLLIITLHKHLTARNFINYYFAQISYCTEVTVIANDKNKGIEV